MYRKKIKNRPLNVSSLREPSPVDNREQRRQCIIDELDVIKMRVDQVPSLHSIIVSYVSLR